MSAFFIFDTLIGAYGSGRIFEVEQPFHDQVTDGVVTFSWGERFRKKWKVLWAGNEHMISMYSLHQQNFDYKSINKYSSLNNTIFWIKIEHISRVRLHHGLLIVQPLCILNTNHWRNKKRLYTNLPYLAVLLQAFNLNIPFSL